MPKLVILCMAWWISFLCLPAQKTSTEGRVWHLGFNEGKGMITHDAISNNAMTISPSCDWMKGVEGNALLFNGFTTRIIVPPSQSPTIGNDFTIDLFFAPAGYPKTPCPIIYHHRGTCPFSLETDVHGKVVFIVGKEKIVSPKPLTLRTWNRITCSHDRKNGGRLAVNLEEAQDREQCPEVVKTDSNEIWIGRTPAPVACPYENKEIPIYSSLDGGLDEIQIYDSALQYDQILQQGRHKKVPLSYGTADMEERRLPSGPEKPLAFGSWYIPLKYYKQWDDQWRGETPDVVVGFGAELPYRVVFWRGISYAPCFVTEKGNWMSNEFLERKKVTLWGCCENMSDKHADFSSVKILENTPARTVVLWRNAPIGVNQKFPYQDKETLWGDWSEETYTFYPDGTGVRKMKAWSSNLEDWHEWCQSLQVLHPGQRPEDVLDSTRILSVANMKGDAKTFGWEFDSKATQHMATIPQANIQVSYLNSQWNPFLILDDCSGKNDRGNEGPEIERYAGKWSDYSAFPWRNHWPVTQDLVIGRYAVASDGPAHTYTATQYNAPHEMSNGQITKLMLCGCTDKDAGQLLPLAKSWLRAPKITLTGGPCKGGEYELEERAYHLTYTSGSNDDIQLRLDASEHHPAEGFCIVINNWPGGNVDISVNGQTLKNTDYKTGHLQQYDGEKLILWFPIKAQSPQNILLHRNSHNN